MVVSRELSSAELCPESTSSDEQELQRSVRQTVHSLLSMTSQRSTEALLGFILVSGSKHRQHRATSFKVSKAISSSSLLILTGRHVTCRRCC